MERGLKFSIVIPTYNRISLLQETLQTVFSQEYKNYEVIVVDDGSTDDMSDITAEHAHKATFLWQKNAGPGAARNLGIRHSSGDYVAFLDSDDLWFPWTLDVYRELIDEHGRPSMIFGHAFHFPDSVNVAGISHRQRVSAQYYPDYLSSYQAYSWFGASSMVIRRDILDRSGGFTNRWINAEDLDLALRLSGEPGFVSVKQPFTLGYRTHPGSAVHSLEKTLRGIEHLLTQELSHRYPGNDRRRHERRTILTRFVRPPTIAALRHRNFRDALRLYLTTLPWHLSLLRLRFVVGFPVLLLNAYFRYSIKKYG